MFLTPPTALPYPDRLMTPNARAYRYVYGYYS
jgi:hypothetical protein